MNLPVPADNSVSTVNCSLKHLNDDLLVVSAKAGDTFAFVELRERHASKLLRRLYRITRNWEDAEDALQDSIIRAFTHLNKFEGRSSFSTWLTRIAINSALMIVRKKSTCKELSIDGTNDGLEIINRVELLDRSEDPESCYARREREALLTRAMLRLRPALRDVIRLRHLEECSIEELAESLGISLTAAKSRLLRARIALRASLL
jgi:RNA polymerase sigma-70 factor (ECF subfamily)